MTVEFEKELVSLLNRHSIDSYLNTPDFIIAQNIMNNLTTARELLIAREEWHGRNFETGGDSVKLETPLNG